MTMFSRLLLASFVAATFLSVGLAQEKKEKEQPKPQRVVIRVVIKGEFVDDLVAEAPGTWKVQESTKQFRLFEITMPSGEKDVADGTLVITHFGSGGGGDIDANLKRWYGQIEQPDGTPTEKVAKKPETIKTDAAKITWLDLSGTLLDRPFPASPNVTKRPKYRMFTAMIDGGKEGPYWLRATGPEAVMQSHRDGFEKFLKSINKK